MAKSLTQRSLLGNMVEQIGYLEKSLWGSAGLLAIKFDIISSQVLRITVTYKSGYNISDKIDQNIIGFWNPNWKSVIHDQFLEPRKKQNP